MWAVSPIPQAGDLFSQFISEFASCQPLLTIRRDALSTKRAPGGPLGRLRV